MERLNCVAILYGALTIFFLPAAYNGQFPTPTLSTPQSCVDVDCRQGTICRQLEGAPMCVSVNDSICEPNPCANGGSCVPDAVMGYICECSEASLCDRDPACLNLGCGDGTCVLLADTTAECMCPPGLSGRNCSVALNSCDSDPCLNGGTCWDAGMDEQSSGIGNDDMLGFWCFCRNGYDGLTCEIQLICRDQCLNGGTCVENSETQQPSCQCPNDFTGSFCEVPINSIEFAGCRAGVDPVWNFTWEETGFNIEDIQPCPGGEGIAMRFCASQGWQDADVTQCQSNDFIDFTSQASNVFDDDEADLGNQLEQTSTITANLIEATIPQDGSLLPGDLNSTNQIIVGVLELLESTIEDDNVTEVAPQNLLGIFSNVLDLSNLIGWTTLQEVDAGSQLLLDNVERYSIYLANALEDSENRVVNGGNNLVIGWSRSNPSNTERSLFPESVNDLVDAGFDSIPAQVSVPAALLRERQGTTGNTVPVTNVLFRNMEAVLPTGASTAVASMVISTTVSSREFQVQQSEALRDEPVEVAFTFDELRDKVWAGGLDSRVENGSDYRCAFWEFSDPVGNGRWSTDGVETVSATLQGGVMTVECRSVHLSSFAVLVDVSGTFRDGGAELQALMIVSYIGCAISMACLVIAIVFFLTLGKNLFLLVHYFIHLNLAISLFVGYLVFVIGIQTARHSVGGCVFVTVLLHYFFLAAFCWMLCEGIMLYLMLVVVFSRLSKKWWFFLLLGWGLPILPVVIGVAARHDDYGVRNDDGALIYCWLSTDNGVIWAFVGPMLAIIAVNVFFMTVAVTRVYKSTKSKAAKQNTTSKYKEKKEVFVTSFRASVILLPILGLTWVFGLFTVNRNLTAFAWLFTILNSLQGVFIFLFHVLRSEKVWHSTRAKSLRSKASSTFRSTLKGSSDSYSTVHKVSQGSKSEGKVASEKYQAVQEGSSELTGIASSGWSSTVSEHPNEKLQAIPESISLVVIPNADAMDNVKIDLEAGSQDCSG